jgi:ATP-binding cassette subfamily B protein
MDCGATCLRIVAQYYRRKYNADTLNKICPATHEGVSLGIMVNASENLGFRTSCGQTTIKKLVKQRPFPCILHWNNNHFVVLYDIKKTIKNEYRFYISDPGNGLLKFDEESFRKYWLNTQINGEERGILMVLQPTPAFYEREKDQNTKTPLYVNFILQYVKPYKKYFSQLFIGLILASILQLAFPFLTQSIVDIGIKDNDLNIIYLILLGQLVLTLSRISVDFVRRWLILHLGTRFSLSILSDFFIKLMKLPMVYFDTKMTGDIMQRINDHNRIERFVTTQSLNIVFSVFSFIVLSSVILYYDIRIFLVFIIGSLFIQYG